MNKRRNPHAYRRRQIDRLICAAALLAYAALCLVAYAIGVWRG